MQNHERIDELYQMYDFQKEYETKDCNIYIYEQGYFNNAEIVIFEGSDREVVNDLENQYMQMGYAVSKREARDYEDIKIRLFCGFFKIVESKKRVEKEYGEFCRLQKKRLGEIEYSYIESNYTLNGNLCDGHILDHIIKILDCDKAQLIILEAPAGFGKTCTSYEIANIIAKKTDNTVPILAELSKNRTARIFSYVLLSEIDKKFPKLSSNLVTQQINEGNIILIIDGFDELLSKSTIEIEDSAEEAKSMLDTIANLYQEKSRTKILLTSRKSSILTGEIFDDWVTNKINNCEVNRFQILTPTISDWIGHQKKSYLQKTGVDLEYVANPVLLTMLRDESEQEIREKYKNANDVLENYFNLLLEREIDRQQLLLSVKEQRNIMRKLAAMMVQLDISSDEVDGIRSLISDIIEPMYPEYIAKYNEYSDMVEPTEEELEMKIIHSALLDRIKPNSNEVGFINEFIFGVLIGEALIEGEVEINDVSYRCLNLAMTAFSAKNIENRKRLYQIIDKIKNGVDTEQKIMMDIQLLGSLGHDYMDEYISSVVFKSNFNMDTEHYFYNCIFKDCTFEKNKVKNVMFEGCQFINCYFYEFEIEDYEALSEDSSFIACAGYEGFADILKKGKFIQEDKKDDKYYERLVLEQYWMIGSDMAEPRKTYRTLFKGIKQKDKSGVLIAIEDLINRKILKKLTYCIELNFSKLTEIREILGR